MHIVMIVVSWSEMEVMTNESEIVPMVEEKHLKFGADISLLSHMG